MKKQTLLWRVGYSDSPDTPPAAYFPASVPGAVQLDYLKSIKAEPFYKGTNFKDLKWAEDKYWVYLAEMKTDVKNDEVALLKFEGLDYSCRIYVNGNLLYRGEGMFSPVTLDVTKYSGASAEIKVVFDPVPKINDLDNRSQAAESVKSCACYGWDWHPRLISTGIWGDAYVEIKKSAYIKALDVKYALRENNTLCTLYCDAETSGAAELEYTLLYNGEAVACGEGIKAEIDFSSPKLWSPVGYGEQNMYELVGCLSVGGDVVDTVRRKIGFRSSKLVMNEGAWQEPKSMPKTRSNAPACLEINGQRVFAKGTNWVNAQVFPSDMSEENYRELLTLVKNANMNIVRVWGGGFVNKESFFDICDELGIMVWQEFPLACNEYPDKDGYLNVLQKEATAIVKRLRTHPSVVLWCGGNELFNNWSKMTDQHHALRLLNSICYTEDRFTPFIYTSPLCGMAHGHYCAYDAAENAESYELLKRSHNTAYTEFGVPSIASREVLKTFMSDADIEDCNENNEIWVAHHAFKAWHKESWAHLNEVEYFFGGYGDTDDLILKTNAMQSMVYKAEFEEMRRRWPYTAMALNWCFNEPWPTAANNSLVSWPVIVKPAYLAVKDALRPQMASIDTEKLRFSDGETLRAGVWVLNDSADTLVSGTVTAYCTLNGQTVKLASFDYGDIPPRQNKECGAVSVKLPQGYSGNICISVKVEGREDMDSQYSFPCIAKKSKKSVTPELNV